VYAGDGTTLSTLFANQIVERGLKAIKNGFHPVFLKKGIDKGKAELVKILNEMKLPMTKNEKGEYLELLSVCRVSSNHDETIA
jgi:chaperonin GroEL